jgi:hypothetical protein
MNFAGIRGESPVACNNPHGQTPIPDVWSGGRLGRAERENPGERNSRVRAACPDESGSHPSKILTGGKASTSGVAWPTPGRPRGALTTGRRRRTRSGRDTGTPACVLWHRPHAPAARRCFLSHSQEWLCHPAHSQEWLCHDGRPGHDRTRAGTRFIGTGCPCHAAWGERSLALLGSRPRWPCYSPRVTHSPASLIDSFG